MPTPSKIQKPRKGPLTTGAAVASVSSSGPWLRGREAVAEHLGGISVKTVDAWVAGGVLPFSRLPGSRLLMFRRADVDAAVQRFATEVG